MLTVVERIENSKDGSTQWLCKCDCGNFRKVQGKALVWNCVKSCGCFYFTKRLNKGESAFKHLYRSYKRGAKRRNIDFNLTIEEFKILTQNNCEICDTCPSIFWKGCGKHYGHYLYNGIDRIDNTKGYNKINSQTLCKLCNRAKNDLTPIEFQTWLNKIKNSSYNIFDKIKELL